MDALSRIKQLGMPRRNDELWTFFPIAKIPAPEFPMRAPAMRTFRR